MRKWISWIITSIILVAVGFYGYSVYQNFTKETLPVFKTEPVRRGDITSKISATGTIEPEDLIDVGAQVAGRIIEFGMDNKGKVVDYGSQVSAGTVLAKIDDVIYRSDLESAQAALKKAKADMDSSRANLKQYKAKFEQARRNWERAKKLGVSDALAKNVYDNYRSEYEVAKANVEVGEVAIKQAKTVIEQEQAKVNRARQNLSFCVIKAPVDGVIIDRRVNIGQTVVASLNAPSLFLIAKDLRNVQIWVAVNEADIGSIYVGQPVSFTVDAHPREKFQGVVGKIRLNASMTQNVVSYTVEVDIDNSDGRLLPYLTASVEFETAHYKNVFLAPKAAVRWNPPPELMKKDSNENDQAQTPKEPEKSQAEDLEKGKIWILENNKIRPIHINIGIIGDSDAQISGPEVKEGLLAVVGIEENGNRRPDGANPFVPQFRFGKKGRAH